MSCWRSWVGVCAPYLQDKGELPDASLLAMAPISVRSESEKGSQGNQVSSMVVSVASNVADPLERLRAVRESTHQSKEFSSAVGARALTEYSQFIPGGLAALAARTAARFEMANRVDPAANCVVTNVPGPREPLYFAGAKLVTMFGMGPIGDGLGLMHPVTSYVNELVIAVTSCREMLPDPAVYAAMPAGLSRRAGRGHRGKNTVPEATACPPHRRDIRPERSASSIPGSVDNEAVAAPDIALAGASRRPSGTLHVLRPATEVLDRRARRVTPRAVSETTVKAPSPALQALEQFAVLEYGALVASSPFLRVAGRGDRHPVLVLPGFTASDRSTAPLRAFLRTHGYWVHGWGLGRNMGPRPTASCDGTSATHRAGPENIEVAREPQRAAVQTGGAARHRGPPRSVRRRVGRPSAPSPRLAHLFPRPRWHHGRPRSRPDRHRRGP